MNVVRWMTLRVVLLCGVLLLTGCSPTAEPKGIWGKLWKIEVGPDYKRPEVAPVEEFRSQLGPSESALASWIPRGRRPGFRYRHFGHLPGRVTARYIRMHLY